MGAGYSAEYESNPNRESVKITDMKADMNPLNRFFAELQVKPETFAAENGRFALRSKEGNEVYPHCNIMQQHSVDMKRFLDGNLDGIRDGIPLSLPCSNAALSSLLHLIYQQKTGYQFIVSMVEILEVANLWQMKSVMELCFEQMRHLVQNHLIKEFDCLIQWFVASVKFEVKLDNDEMLEWEILSQLMRLAHQDTKKGAIMNAQAIEYIRDKSAEDIAALMMRLNR